MTGVLWVKDTASRIDIANGFIEVYLDPMHKERSYESVLSLKDLKLQNELLQLEKSNAMVWRPFTHFTGT